MRVNFNYFISEATFQYLLEAIDLVAQEGWRLLPDYTFCPKTGQWRHRAGRPEPVMRLHDVDYSAGHMEFRSRHATEPASALKQYLAEARRVLAERRVDAETAQAVSADFEQLRWFPLPSEAAAEIRGDGVECPCNQPIHLQ